MEGMSRTTPPPSTATMNGVGGMRHKTMMMHRTFYWGNRAEILFTHWPGDNSGMFILALFFVFFMAFLAECLSHCRILKQGSNRVASGLVQTLIHTFRVAFTFLVMLALMSFNLPVFLAALAGHALGFFFFASRALPLRQFDFPPITC